MGRVISLDRGCRTSYVMIVCDTILFIAVNLDRVVKRLKELPGANRFLRVNAITEGCKGSNKSHEVHRTDPKASAVCGGNSWPPGLD